MINLEEYTPTELLKLGNDFSAEHKKLKESIIQKTLKIDEIEKSINVDLEKLKTIEEIYVKIIEEIDKR